MRKRHITFTSVFVALACFGVLPQMHAIAPTPDGCYPNYTTAEGCNALNFLTTGAGNTGVGWYSLFAAGASNFNTGVGAGALALNTADSNTAVGAVALFLNTSGMQNVAVGTGALLNNNDGVGNIAIGYNALPNNTTGEQNTAIGYNAMRDNTTGSLNTAVGLLALINNTEGGNNTAIGRNAMQNNETGAANTAIGYRAGLDVTGDGNVCIGSGALGVAGVDDTTWIRNVNTLTQNFSAGVNDYVTVRLSDGRLGHTAVVSSRRYKEDIKPLAAVSEALYALNPVSFRLKKKYDETQRRSFGLIAEEVEKIDPDLVYYNNKGQAESVRYEMVNAMLLNEFLKEHRKIEEQQAAIAALKSELQMVKAEQQRDIQTLTARLEQQASQIQSVQRLDTARRLQSAQIEMNKVALGRIRRGGTAAQTVVNNP
jgi:hypothetical protein